MLANQNPPDGREQLPREPSTEEEILEQTILKIGKLLPLNMNLTIERNRNFKEQNRQYNIDGILEIKAAGLRKIRFLIEIKKTSNIRDLSDVLSQLEAYKKRLNEDVELILISRFIPTSAQSWLRERQISYADSTGNFLIVSTKDGLYLMGQGASSNPWRMPGRPTGSLKGEPVAKIVRALIDTRPPMSIPELINRARSSSGVAYRGVELLESEGLLSRKNGKIIQVEWMKLLERWSTDYSFLRSNNVMGYLAPRGIDYFLSELRKSSLGDYVITGSVAAQRLAPYAEPQQLMLYARYPNEMADKTGIRQVDSGANILLAATNFEVVFDGTLLENGLIFAAASQVVIDLLNGPGRNPSEGRELMNWMARHENEWRK
jgi:hypothetical protein